MTATNHVITGSTLLAAFSHPAALPFAFVLHFFMDGLPHYGNSKNPVASLERLKFTLPIDAAVAGSILITIFVLSPDNALLLILGGILCASPDLAQIPRYIRFLRTGDAMPSKDKFSKFHSEIQKYERGWGVYVEIIWFIVMFAVFANVAF